MAEAGPSRPAAAAAVAAGDFPELLAFCARAEALIAELLLLSDRAPSQFADRRFHPVLFDFRYFDSPGEFEARIEGNMELEALEDELRESCGSYMRRFFALLDAAVAYHDELCSYLNDLQEGLYVHCTLDGVLESNWACQLLTESMTLFGCMALLMEHRISGLLRERLLVAYLRHERCFSFPNVERICKLCRRHVTTPPSPGASGSSLHTAEIISVQKPEDLLRRFQFPELIVDAVITCLRNGDVYNNVRFYPDPQHRTTALSLQGGHIYVLLFYSRDLLHNGLAMREIVDRFFKDNWVVPIFLHFSVDLLVSWDAFKEAKSSLVSCLSPTFVRDRSLYHYTKVSSLLADLDSHMHAVNKEYVLDNSLHLLSIIRECNCTLRWLLLHRMTNDKKARDLVICLGSSQHADEGKLLQLLMKTAKLEFEVKELHAELLKTRKSMWYEKRHDALECMKDLSQNYLGTWAASCKLKNKSIKDWLEHLSSESWKLLTILYVSSLDYATIGNSGRIIHRVLSTLKDIELLHQIKENIQIKHGFSKIQKNLHDMIKVLNLNQESISVFSVITDGKYAWGYLTYFEELLKKKISQDPSESLFLHTMFLKFQSWLDAPLQRIKQYESPDLQYVSTYYASKYAAQIFAVLDIIPAILLKISIDVDYINAEQSTHLINRINKETLEDLMQLDQQLCQAQQAAKLCIVSEGLLNMSKNFDGLIDLNLGGWLKQMIKKELVSQLQGKLKALSLLIYGDIEGNLMSLSNYMLSQMQRMEFLQHILHIDGCSIWEETLTAVLEECAKREVLEFMGCMQPSTNMVKPSNHMSPAAIYSSFNGSIVLHVYRGYDGLVDVKCREELNKLDDLLGPPMSIPLMGWSSYKEMVKMLHSSWGPLVEKLATIGQLQLVRNLVSFKLRSACKVRANTISSAVDILSSSVCLQNGRFETGAEDHNVRLFLNNIKDQQNFCGLLSPLQAIYISEEPPMFLTRLLCIFSISQLPKYVLDIHLGSLTNPLKKSVADFSALVIGLGTLLQQFGPSHITQYIEAPKALYWVMSFCNMQSGLFESL
uniref:WASH complex subunit strumpellin n=1 Tax=Oryza glumipatula TaxID=40148 RepID=A0A0D9ZK76_9ORYZ